MTPNTIDAIIAKLLEFEASVPFMYLDDAEPPVVTCGIGHAMFSVNDALGLPWSIGDLDALPAQIAADYLKVKQARPGYAAGHYKGLTICRLGDDDIRGLCRAEFLGHLAKFRKHVPDIGFYPVPAQLACGDLLFNLGPDFTVNGEWPKLTLAIFANDWTTAAVQSHRAPPINAARNKYVHDLFLSCVAPVQQR
jgi:hypothetical protein